MGIYALCLSQNPISGQSRRQAARSRRASQIKTSCISKIRWLDRSGRRRLSGCGHTNCSPLPRSGEACSRPLHESIRNSVERHGELPTSNAGHGGVQMHPIQGRGCGVITQDAMKDSIPGVINDSSVAQRISPSPALHIGLSLTVMYHSSPLRLDVLGQR